MNLTDFFAIIPLFILATSIIILILVIAIRRSFLATTMITMFSLALGIISIPFIWSLAPRQVTPLVLIDPTSLIFLEIALVATFFIAWLSFDYVKVKSGRREEYFVLLLLALLGAAILTVSNHFASLLLGLELLSVALYVLIAYFYTNPLSIEAGLKYLILAATSATFLFFGAALIYADTGNLAFSQITAFLTSNQILSPLFLTGMGMIFVGIGFKLAVVPFHMWSPDIYQGAPAPVAAFIATVSKGGVVMLLLHLIARSLPDQNGLRWTLVLISVASMFFGSLLALLQKNVKRILGYSSIAHLGYILAALIASSNMGVSAVLFYFAAYFPTMLAAFGVIGILSSSDADADQLEDFQGLFWRKPGLAVVFTTILLSLAGIPLTAGFISKFFVLSATVGSAAWLLSISLVLSSAISLYYYLRIITTMFQKVELEQKTSIQILPLSGSIVLAGLTILVFCLGVFPTPLLQMIQSAISNYF